MSRRKKGNATNTLLGLATLAITGAAIREQLRKAPEERTWEGSILGIPYDFRKPTPERIRERMWNDTTSSIFTPQVFGIGWTLNLHPIVHPKPKQTSK
ncbi:DUF5808 domain-containing protein [Ktedonospora formicarum]|uniref:DUF5808 domain-containing protein n=1 Tax=Ktedonospora formicarum TaxID=2778364 RepID=A0A8J3HV91_9CHLR|nr:DUF5808 domain-containing protein [Ktedonospora formicarum]GHO42601.1 hypothetical protein KSX_07640 [Ktedonospora formicarum]